MAQMRGVTRQAPSLLILSPRATLLRKLFVSVDPAKSGIDNPIFISKLAAEEEGATTIGPPERHITHDGGGPKSEQASREKEWEP